MVSRELPAIRTNKTVVSRSFLCLAPATLRRPRSISRYTSILFCTSDAATSWLPKKNRVTLRQNEFLRFYNSFPPRFVFAFLLIALSIHAAAFGVQPNAKKKYCPCKSTLVLIFIYYRSSFRITMLVFLFYSL